MAHEEEGGKFTWFMMGAALGAACALLYAPKSGKETRDMITQKAQEATDAVIARGKRMLPLLKKYQGTNPKVPGRTYFDSMLKGVSSKT